MMIGVCSFGSTGSGAVIDLLKEYNSICVKDKREFVLTYFPGGFEDLEYALMNQKAKFFSSDIAITKFKKVMHSMCHNEKSFYWQLTEGHFDELINEYIDSICQIQYKGRWMYDDYIFDSLIEKMSFAIKKRIKPLEKYTLRDMYFSIEPSNFYYETQKLLKKIYNFNNLQENIVLDQPFPANNPINSMKLFGEGCKAIIMLRDPRDLYVRCRDYIIKRTRFLPRNDVEEFIQFYKKQYEMRTNSEDVLYIYFEDLIFNYDNTVEKIEKFCGLSSEQHIEKLTKFDPEISLKNTKIYMKNQKYNKEVKKIEQEMSEYLFDFSKYDRIDYSNDIF